MDCKYLLNNKRLYIGGDAELTEAGDLYRGPIKSIELDNNSIIIELEWCAKMPKSKGRTDWEICDIPKISFRKSASMTTGAKDRLFVQVPFIGIMTLFSKDGSQLNPAKVKGLKATAVQPTN